MNTSEHRSEFYGGGKQPEADMPFHFLSVDLDSKLTNLIPYDKGKNNTEIASERASKQIKDEKFYRRDCREPRFVTSFLIS